MPVSMKELQSIDKKVWLTVMVAALGYFVDIYDLLLFSIVRVPSLKDLGFTGEDLLEKGVLLINVQMAGLLTGGILWGILGDKRGRLSVLFGSIIIYSAANLLNGFVQTIEQYQILRFIAGVGLAGELGAGITLISEIMPKTLRGFGTTIVASFGILGAVFGALIGDLMTWHSSYVVGGVMGFAILLLRVGVTESGLFSKAKETNVKRGSFLILLKDVKTFSRFFSCIAIGVPIWFVVGILFTFAPEFGKAMGLTDLPTGGKAVMWGYLGMSIGDLASGLVSQRLKSRKRAIGGFMALTIAAVAYHLSVQHTDLKSFYAVCLVMGIGAGYWAMFVQIAAEQFGTNIRSTVTTSVPNFVRGAVIPLTGSFKYLSGQYSVLQAAVTVGTVAFAIALIALFSLDETFHKDLDYHES